MWTQMAGRLNDKIVNTIERESKEYADENWAGCYAEPGEAAIDSFESGAYWMLSEALAWLKENAMNYFTESAIADDAWFDSETLISDFEKAMEE